MVQEQSTATSPQVDVITENTSDMTLESSTAGCSSPEAPSTEASDCTETTLPQVSAENEAKAEKCKMEANEQFKEKKYVLSIMGYSQAIALNPTKAVYYGNRSVANLKIENYGSALQDASEALRLDPSYVKGYYRRGDAYLAMGKYQMALRDLKTALSRAPNDATLKLKVQICEKEVKLQRFQQALASPDTDVRILDSVKVSDMVVPDSYTGPRMDDDGDGGCLITQEFIDKMTEEFRAQRLIHARYAFEIVTQTAKLLDAESTLVEINIPDDEHFTVCGDVHGQYYDLLNIFKLNGTPSKDNPYLFNGDFVDRGSFSVEVILTLMAYKLLYPKAMFLNRGNHESSAMTKIYGFQGEVKHKYSQKLADLFQETFQLLPLAFVLNKKVIVVHGGLFEEDGVTLDDIKKVNRKREPPESGIMCDVLWSDPHPQEGRLPSKRGVGVAFGPDVTKAFLEANGLELIVRSHETKDNGYEVEHDERLITVFSAPNYCDQMGNKGAFVKFQGSKMTPHFTTFTAVQHPPVKPMQYATPYFLQSFGM